MSNGSVAERTDFVWDGVTLAEQTSAAGDVTWDWDGQGLRALTQRERQVFDRLVRGEANKLIARHLEISPRTVEVYKARMMEKLHVHDAVAVTRYALQAGLTTLE